MCRIAIIGAGNVGYHLFKAFSESYQKVVLINSRTLDGLTKNFDLLIVAVSDTAIVEVLANITELIPDFEGIITHTSGTVDISVLNNYFRSFGVFYPLQSFSKNIPVGNYKEIPIFIEGNSQDTENTLKMIAKPCFDNVVVYTSQRRRQLHLASVFACNFVNAMFGISENILAENGIPFKYLHPLIEYTCKKVLQSSPILCQTGPARRGDTLVMESHLKQLDAKPEEQSIYALLSSYLLKKYKHEQN